MSDAGRLAKLNQLSTFQESHKKHINSNVESYLINNIGRHNEVAVLRYTSYYSGHTCVEMQLLWARLPFRIVSEFTGGKNMTHI